MIIELNDELQQEESLLALMKQAGELCLKNEGLDFSDETVEVSLSFVLPEEIREINRDYRNKDAVTDVLSFPQYNNREEITGEPYVCLGDVIICPERAREQAEEYGHSYTREMVYLMVHSMLHLLGYDHMEEDEKAIMREREEAVMNQIGVLRQENNHE